MITGLKPYPEYKDSEVLSVGDIPSHWKMIRSGYLFREVIDTGHPDLKLLSIDRFRGIIRQSDVGRKERASKDRSLYKRIRQGQLGYNLMNAFMGSIGISRYDGIISPAYAVGQPQKEMNPWYYHHLYRMPIYAAEINRYSYGIMYERNRLYFDYFKRIPVPYPPVDEQNNIVAAIHQAEKKFFDLIKVKRHIIDLLNEQKQSIINRAITRGIDPNVRLKPSGIGWLGDIPEQWEVVPWRRLILSLKDFGSNGSFASLRQNVKYLYEEDYARLVRLVDLRKGMIPKEGIYVSEKCYNFLSHTPLFGGEFLIANVGAYAGYVCEMPKVEKPSSLGPNMMMAKKINKLKVTTKYLIVSAQSSVIQNQLRVIASQSAAQPKLDKDDVRSIVTPLPPITEQLQIIDYLENKLTMINDAILSINQQIGLIRENSTRLINDIVTGKVDVRAMKIDKIPASESEDQNEEFGDNTVIDSEDIDQMMD